MFKAKRKTTRVQASPVSATDLVSACVRVFAMFIPGSGTFFQYLSVVGERMSTE